MTTTITTEPTRTHSDQPAITTRDLDDTLTAVDRAGQLLAFVYQDPDSGWWLIQDRRRITRIELGDFIGRDAAAAYVTARADWFDQCPAAAPPEPRDAS